MRIKNRLLLGGCLCFLLLACIKEEAPNAEADILSATLSHADNLLEEEPVIGNNYVIFRLKSYQEDYHFSPQFELTPGAKITPKSGTEQDFSEPRQYTVTSENGLWQKTYEVSFTFSRHINLKYAFENVDTINTQNPEGHYHKFFRYNPEGQKVYDWATGNPGYNILAASLVPAGAELTPSFYPTFQTDEGYQGRGVVLQTKATGPLGETVGSPLAAGNLFVGDFILTFPSINSPHFGRPYHADKAPVALKGYFKYQAGEDFVVNNEPSNLSRDRWDAYAILFEKRETDNYLPGDHHFEDPRMLSVAHLNPEKAIETDQWTAFYIPFHEVNGKSFDPDEEYMYTIVFTSSTEGGVFNGAVGSKLWIDEVQLILEDTIN